MKVEDLSVSDIGKNIVVHDGGSVIAGPLMVIDAWRGEGIGYAGGAIRYLRARCQLTVGDIKFAPSLDASVEVKEA